MARVKIGYPIADVWGKMGNLVFVRYPWGIDIQQYTPMASRVAGEKALANNISCTRFAKADKLYSAFPESEKNIWRRAVKKPGITGYTLWMKECLYLWGRGESSPLKPSISGGYTREKAIPGGPYPAPT